MTTVERLAKYFPLAGGPSIKQIELIANVSHKTNPAVFGQVIMADGEMVLRLVGWKKGAKNMTDKWKECDDSVWESFDRITATELWTRETEAMNGSY